MKTKGRKTNARFRGSTLFDAENQTPRPLWNNSAIGTPCLRGTPPAFHRRRFASCGTMRDFFPNLRRKYEFFNKNIIEKTDVSVKGADAKRALQNVLTTQFFPAIIIPSKVEFLPERARRSRGFGGLRVQTGQNVWKWLELSEDFDAF